MSKFNINRFGKTLLWSAKMTQKEILTNVAAMFFAFAVPFIIHLLSSYKGSEMHTASNLTTAMQLNILIYIIITVIGGCWLFSNMKTKEQRIMFKMLPATDLEKFIARALYVTVVWWLMAYVAFCLADVFRMLVSLIAGIDVVRSVIPEFTSILIGTSEHTSFTVNSMRADETYAVLALAYAWGFWMYSFYILGGTLLRRRQFVLTTLAHFAIGMVFTPILVNYVDGVDPDTARQLAVPLAWTGAAFFTAWGIADWILSYKIFRRMQVINNKWLNL